MKIKVRDIRPEGIEIVDRIGLDIFEYGKKEDSRFTQPLEVTAKVERVSNTVRARTAIKGIYRSLCARCLEPIEQNWSKVFLFSIPINTQIESIDLNEEIRQETLLNLPQKILCREDCKGLCLGCGVNLNTEACQCKSKRS